MDFPRISPWERIFPLALPRMSRTGCAFDGGRRDRGAHAPTPRTRAARGLRKGARGGPGIAASTAAGRAGLTGLVTDWWCHGCCLKGCKKGKTAIENHGTCFFFFKVMFSNVFCVDTLWKLNSLLWKSNILNG